MSEWNERLGLERLTAIGWWRTTKSFPSFIVILPISFAVIPFHDFDNIKVLFNFFTVNLDPPIHRPDLANDLSTLPPATLNLVHFPVVFNRIVPVRLKLSGQPAYSHSHQHDLLLQTHIVLCLTG